MILARRLALAAALVASLGVALPTPSACAQEGAVSSEEPPASAEADVDPRRDERARELFAQGDEAYEAGRYEVAITLWREAYGVSARPLLLYNLANAYERLGRLEEAASSLEGYLPDADESERDAIRSRIALLRQRMAAEAASAVPAAPPVAEPVAAPPAPSPAPVEGSSLPVAPIALFSGAGLALVAGVVMAVLASDASGRASPFCRTVDDALYCTPDAGPALDEASAFALTADLALGLALGLAAAASIAIVIDSSGDSEVAVTLAPTSLQARWRF